jgi:hypothetical protein
MKPVSLTSSIVWPMDRTRVPLGKDRTMYESNSSEASLALDGQQAKLSPSCVNFKVHTAVGTPGSGDATIGLTSNPCLSVRKVLLGPRPQVA